MDSFPEKISSVACHAALELDNCNLNRPQGFKNVTAVADWILESFPEGTATFLDLGLNSLAICSVGEVLEKVQPERSWRLVGDVVTGIRQWGIHLLRLAKEERYQKEALDFLLELSRQTWYLKDTVEIEPDWKGDG